VIKTKEIFKAQNKEQMRRSAEQRYLLWYGGGVGREVSGLFCGLVIFVTYFHTKAPLYRHRTETQQFRFTYFTFKM